MKKLIRFDNSGWRGVLADDITFENIRVIVKAFSEFLEGTEQKQNGVVLGCDSRFLSYKFLQEIAKVFAANKIKSYIIQGECPSAFVPSAVDLYNAGGGIYVTGGSYPYEFSGLKIYSKDLALLNTEQCEIIEKKSDRIISEDFEIEIMSYEDAVHTGFIQFIHIEEEYIKRLKTTIDFNILREKELNILFDPMHGSGRTILPNIFKSLGYNVEVINDEKDPYFGKKQPDPKKVNLKQLINKMKVSPDYDIAVAVDGDCDKLGVIDRSGNYISMNSIIPVMLSYLMRSRAIKGDVVRNTATTHLIDKIAENYGFETIETPLGFRYIGDVMVKRNIILGAEESGGIAIGSHLPDNDAAAAVLLLLEILIKEDMEIKDIIKDIYREFGSFFNRQMVFNIWRSSFDYNYKYLLENPPKKILNFRIIDTKISEGIKFILEDESWLYIRPILNEGKVKLYAESSHFERVSQLLEFGKRILFKK